MSHETIALLVSVLSLIVATTALIRGHKLAKKQVEMQKKEAALAQALHKQLVRDQEVKTHADLRASFERQSGITHRFILRNLGPATARNVRLAATDGQSKPDALVDSQVRQFFPAAEILPGDDIVIIAAIMQSTILPLNYIVTWDDDAGKDQQRVLKVTIS
jgi:hypothetical protein